jgi:hypothetical protein
MKKVILLGLFFTLFSCKEEEKEVRIITPEQAEYEAVQNKILEGEEIIESWHVEELEYKGHTVLQIGDVADFENETVNNR